MISRVNNKALVDELLLLRVELQHAVDHDRREETRRVRTRFRLPSRGADEICVRSRSGDPRALHSVRRTRLLRNGRLEKIQDLIS